VNENLRAFNALPDNLAEAALLACCGSAEWAARLTRQRPFAEAKELLHMADTIWWDLAHDDWLQAFRAHPKIGEKKAVAEQSAQAREWSEKEQASTQGASPETLAALAEANHAYEKHFGYIFIVCATGKSTEEMLALLEQRLQNDPVWELRIAAEEQRRITRLRLERFLGL